MHLVEVKAPVRLHMLKQPFGSQPVRFTRKEALEFSESPVPIDVFLWDYDGVRPITEQRDRIFYALVRFEGFEVVEELATTVKDASPKSVSCTSTMAPSKNAEAPA